MRTYELLREGEWTDGDHRMITPETVTWPIEPIPLLARTKGYDSEIIGYVYNIRREGNRILGDTDLTLRADQALTAECDYGTAQQVSRGRIEMTGVRLRAAYVNDKKNYPWSDQGDEQGEGGDSDAS